MAKSNPVMQPTDVDPAAFLAQVEHDTRRADAERMVQLMREVTGEPPVMWGPSIIGFGTYHYVYASGREGDAPAAAFSPRKANLVVYLMNNFTAQHPEQLAALGPHKASKACLYLTNLAKVDEAVLRFLIQDSYDTIKTLYPNI